MANIGMIERRNGMRLALEALAELSSADFDRDVALQPRIPRLVNLSHAARADLREHFVMTKFGAGGERHIRDLFSLLDQESELLLVYGVVHYFLKYPLY